MAEEDQINTEIGREERQALHGDAYVESFERKHTVDRIVRFLPLMGLTGSEDILDVGCGNALSLDALKGRFSSYTGVDFSQPFIDAARQRTRSLGIENAEFFCDTAEAIAEQNAGRFDVALAFDLSEHVYDKEWRSILRAIYEMLRPGGRLFLHTPNSAFFVEILKERNIILKQFPEHIAVRNMAENIKLLEAESFRISAAHGLPHYNILSILHPLSKLPLVGRFFEARLFIEAQKPA